MNSGSRLVITHSVDEIGSLFFGTISNFQSHETKRARKAAFNILARRLPPLKPMPGYRNVLETISIGADSSGELVAVATYRIISEGENAS